MNGMPGRNALGGMISMIELSIENRCPDREAWILPTSSGLQPIKRDLPL
jgi:hypothetical protein